MVSVAKKKKSFATEIGVINTPRVFLDYGPEQ
jgi:hypothetical protein